MIEAIEQITDNIISISMVFSGIYFILVGIEVPEWFVLAIGLVIAFYFRKE